MARKTWEIPFLEEERDTVAAARIILSHRLHDLLILVRAFRRTHHEETLHQLRIATRRLRYPLETFVPFLSKGPSKRFIRLINGLQKSAGDARDTDVLLCTLRAMRAEGEAAIPEKLLKRLDRRRLKEYGAIDRAFEEFQSHPELYAFKRTIEYDANIIRYVDRLRESGLGMRRGRSGDEKRKTDKDSSDLATIHTLPRRNQ